MSYQHPDDLALVPELLALAPAEGKTFLAFNLVQQALVSTLIDLGIAPRFSACQMPCNVRIASGVARVSSTPIRCRVVAISSRACSEWPPES